jgi:predicted Zn-dependent protease
MRTTTLSAKARAVSAPQYDPYSQFRDVSYSNNGLLSEKDEISLGARLHLEVQKKYKLTDVGLAKVNRLGQSVARVSRRSRLVYRFYVIESKEINGFSLPGGYVYITTGLLKLANDNELASVLAHEVGHVAARHSLESLKKSQENNAIADTLGAITGIAGDTARELGTALAKIVGEGFLTLHSREEEREADFLGVRALPKAGVDPQAMVTMFEKLQKVDDSGLLGSFFSDHPNVQERIDNTRSEIARMRKERTSRQ